ncbi:MAG: hypothetical protein OXG72_07820, partial [Acidobacteria bacterium]|nr:hypothetical protein [Acidobacteriota bacterium]
MAEVRQFRTEAEWIKFFELVEHQGWTINAAAEEVGIDKSSAYKVARDGKHTAVSARAWDKFTTMHKEVQGVPSLDDLSPEATQCLENVSLFALRYFGITLAYFQEVQAYKAAELIETDFEEYVVINVAPGTGKSTFSTKILPAWMTCRDRSIRGQIGSASRSLAAQYVDGLRTEFMRDIPFKPNLIEERTGLVRSAAACLRHDYGLFKPPPGTPGTHWKAESFKV